ncbi:restriction endonuclease subunit S [Helicobacter pylori]|nr:restriction endonuclease subunit S [Helicobacter pylori]
MDALTTPSNWQRVRLGDILTLKHGRDYKKFKLGNIPVYGSGGYMLSINNFLHNGESVCIGRKGTIDKPIYLNGKFWVVDTLFYSYSFKKSIPKFIFYAFSIIKWSNYNEATGVPSLTKMTISNIEIPLPPLNEQAAIADVLSDVDRYLYNLDALILKKESVKKALSFELLSQRKRLKGFNQAWQRVRLGDIGKPCMCKRVMKHQTTRYGEIPFYKIGTFGNTADAFISKKLFLEYKTKYSFPKKGDILISASGTIGRAVIYDGKPAYFQDSNIVWIDNDETLVKNDFLFYAYSNVKWNTEHTTILRLYNDNFRNTLIPLPPLNEQSAIANILSDVDSEIISLKNKKRQFENIKKALNHDLMSAKIRVLKK